MAWYWWSVLIAAILSGLRAWYVHPEVAIFGRDKRSWLYAIEWTTYRPILAVLMLIWGAFVTFLVVVTEFNASFVECYGDLLGMLR